MTASTFAFSRPASCSRLRIDHISQNSSVCSAQGTDRNGLIAGFIEEPSDVCRPRRVHDPQAHPPPPPRPRCVRAQRSRVVGTMRPTTSRYQDKMVDTVYGQLYCATGFTLKSKFYPKSTAGGIDDSMGVVSTSDFLGVSGLLDGRALACVGSC